MSKEKQKLLSLCIITKNEEDSLPVCLKHAKKIADEVIIVDTGSTDQTIQTAKKLGAKVYKKKWNDDFSAVRNHALEKATGKWILFLDADETLSQQEADKIRSLLDNPMAEGYLFYIDTHMRHQEITSQTQALRLFRNRKEYRYQNRVFERIPEELLINVKDSGITIQHKQDQERYTFMQQLKLNLLEEEVKLHPEDSYLHYVYGIALINQKKYEESIEPFQTAIKHVNQLNLFSPHLYKLLTWALIMIQDYEKAITFANQGIKYFPFYTDLIFLRGKSYNALNKYQEGITDFEACLKLGDAPPAMVSEPGMGSYNALFALGEIHEELLNTEKALEYYKQAYEQNKSFEDALYQIGHIIKQNPELGNIDQFLLQWMNPSDPEQTMTLIDILCLEREYKTALHYTEKVEKIIGLREDIIFVRGICYMLMGEAPEAEKYFSFIPENHPFYEQVLLRRIQNYWFDNQWKKAQALLKKISQAKSISEATKEVYLQVHQMLTNHKFEPNSFTAQGYQILAKIMEHLLWMNQTSKAKLLLDWLLLAKEEQLWLKIGGLFTDHQEMESVLKILDHIKDKMIRSKYIEKIAKHLYLKGDMKEAEQILKLEPSSEMDVQGYFIWSRIWLSKTLAMINTSLKSRKIDKETKKKLSHLKELISNEH